eukprot:gene3665-3717_t
MIDPAALVALDSLATNHLAQREGLVVLGLSGAQGSGKSTLAAELHRRFAARGIATATLSLDDLYHTLAKRQRLARTVHPLLITRGVPGTHDVALGLATIAALARGEAVPLPRFDKARDDRRPAAAWDRAPPHTRLLLFEGWCLGARPQDEAALAVPINALEADEDRDGRWRHHVNAALAGDHAALWARIDALAMLRAPDFATVAAWRGEQEAALRRREGNGAGIMDGPALVRFVAHFERITRHLLADLPDRADCVLTLDARRRVTATLMRNSGQPRA